MKKQIFIGVALLSMTSSLYAKRPNQMLFEGYASKSSGDEARQVRSDLEVYTENTRKNSRAFLDGLIAESQKGAQGMVTEFGFESDRTITEMKGQESQWDNEMMLLNSEIDNLTSELSTSVEAMQVANESLKQALRKEDLKLKSFIENNRMLLPSLSDSQVTTVLELLEEGEGSEARNIIKNNSVNEELVDFDVEYQIFKHFN